MKKLMTCLALGTFATLLGVAYAPAATAQINTEKSLFTLTEPMDVGGAVLEPGTYRIKVVELSFNRNVVQVTNETGSRVFATVLATPHVISTDEAIPESRFIYYTAIAGQPKALRTWFAHDTPYGQDIIYPKRRAMELAAAAKVPVIAIPDEVKEAEYKTVPFTVVTPDQTVKPYEAPVVVVQKAPEAAPLAVAEASPEKQLPTTASHVPLYAALGLLSLGAAIGLHAFASRTA
jgi:hypothetical protein